MWEGGLILKNSLFPTKLHVVEGNRHITDILVSPETGTESNSLKITQRLRLDQSKLEDVTKRMLSASSHAIFLAVVDSTPPLIENTDLLQSRPLKNLILYLKQKEAAGVISLNEVRPCATISLDILLHFLYFFSGCPLLFPAVSVFYRFVKKGGPQPYRRSQR